MTKKSRISILLAAMMAFSVVSAVTPVIAAEPDSIEYIYYNSVELDGDSFVFTLTETTPTVSTFGLDTVESYSKTVTSVKVTPVTEDYYNEMYAEFYNVASAGTDTKTRYGVDTSLSYNMYLEVTFDVIVNGLKTAVRVNQTRGGYYGYGGSGSEIGSGVSVVGQEVLCAGVGKGADGLSGSYVNDRITYNPSASYYDWSYRLPTSWEYVDVTPDEIGSTSQVGVIYTTTAQRGTSTWDSSVQANY